MSGVPAFDGPTIRQSDGQVRVAPESSQVSGVSLPATPLGSSVGSSDLRSPGPVRHVPRPSDRRTVGPLEPVIIAESAAMRCAVELARRFAPTNLPILLVGETGTGKEVLAQAIHRWSRRTGPLVDVDCGSLSPGMIVAELFGHRRGAYTGAHESGSGMIERSDGGTLFLDEIGSLPPEGQSALLRVLETGQVRRIRDSASRRVNLRLIGAVQEVATLRATGRLREDLHQRLAGAVVRLEPLRDRPSDILPLALAFARQTGHGVAGDAIALLTGYSWPGNVRELRVVIARAATLESGPELTPPTIQLALALGAETPAPSRVWPPRVEVGALVHLCLQHNWHAPTIATALRMSRATLFRRLKELGVTLRQLRRTGDLEALRRRETP